MNDSTNEPTSAGNAANTQTSPQILDNPDDPNAFCQLDEAQQTALLAYITAKFKPGKSVYPKSSSYGLKHVFEESTGGFYVTNGQFKGAMQRAGFEPTDPKRQNWLFRLAAAQPCAGRLIDKGMPFGSNPCYHKPDPVSGLCTYHAERKARRLSIDATVYPDRESWLAAMDTRRGVK